MFAWWEITSEFCYGRNTWLCCSLCLALRMQTVLSALAAPCAEMILKKKDTKGEKKNPHLGPFTSLLPLSLLPGSFSFFLHPLFIQLIPFPVCSEIGKALVICKDICTVPKCNKVNAWLSVVYNSETSSGIIN